MTRGLADIDAGARVPTVLIIEDDPETRRFYISVFEGDGFAARAAHNGWQALEKIAEAPPDLILTDIAVPGVDGIELCRRLRGDEVTRAIPVIAVTGYEDRRYPDRALLAGANRVLLKPLSPERLVMEARQLLRDAATRVVAASARSEPAGAADGQ